MASSTGARYFLIDDEGSGVGWTCNIEPGPMGTPPAWATVRVDRDELVAAIDRLQTGPETVVVLAIAADGRRLTLRHREGDATERDRLRQRYAHLAGRSVVFGFESLGIVVTAATPEALVEATAALIVEATRRQLPARAIRSLGDGLLAEAGG
jgi:hypothetical protein